jgi:hypothetical protein
MGLDDEFSKAERDFDAIKPPSFVMHHSENLRLVCLIDDFESQGTPYPGQEHGPDPLLLWSFVKPDRDDFNICDQQLQYNFHWLESHLEKFVGLYFGSKVGDSRGQGDDFIRIFMGTPERLKEIEGFSTCRKSPPCESAQIFFLLRRLANSTSR